MRLSPALVALLLAALSCGGDEPPPGPECLVSADCEGVRVCVEELCRAECNALEDCPTGRLCVLVTGDVGVCQRDRDVACTLSSDCPMPLVCRRGTCLNVCELDVDCPFSGICASDGEGGNVCMPTGGCVIDAECPAMNVCYFGACVPECRADMDCPSDSACIDMRCLRRG